MSWSGLVWSGLFWPQLVLSSSAQECASLRQLAANKAVAQALQLMAAALHRAGRHREGCMGTPTVQSNSQKGRAGKGVAHRTARPQAGRLRLSGCALTLVGASPSAPRVGLRLRAVHALATPARARRGRMLRLALGLTQ